MARDDNLASRVRATLSRVRGVEEKKMFGSLAFMVRGKMCVTARPERIMCRIDPELHDDAVKRKAWRTEATCTSTRKRSRRTPS
jgi:TfoX N-terminal domain